MAARRLVAAQGEQLRRNSFSHSRFSCCHFMSLFFSSGWLHRQPAVRERAPVPINSRCSRFARCDDAAVADSAAPAPSAAVAAPPPAAPVLCEAGAAASTALPLPPFSLLYRKKCCTHTREMRANLVKIRIPRSRRVDCSRFCNCCNCETERMNGRLKIACCLKCIQERVWARTEGEKADWRRAQRLVPSSNLIA